MAGIRDDRPLRPALVAGGLAALLVVAALATSGPRAPLVSEGPTRTPTAPPTGAQPTLTEVTPTPLPGDFAPFGRAWDTAMVWNVLGWLILAAVVGLVAWLLAHTQAIVPRRGQVARGRRLAEPVEMTEIDHEVVVETLQEALERLRAGLDLDDAIIECWRRLEEVASGVGVDRRPTDTAEEFTVAVLTATPAGESDLRRLADLYRRAMFSATPPTAADRDAAIALLQRLASDLDAVTP